MSAPTYDPGDVRTLLQIREPLFPMSGHRGPPAVNLLSMRRLIVRWVPLKSRGWLEIRWRRQIGDVQFELNRISIRLWRRWRPGRAPNARWLVIGT